MGGELRRIARGISPCAGAGVLSARCIDPGSVSQPTRMRDRSSSPLLSHGASWRTIYLQGIDNAETIATVHARKAPMMPASTGLRI